MKNGYSSCTEDAMKEEGYTRLTGGYGSLSNGARKESYSSGYGSLSNGSRKEGYSSGYGSLSNGSRKEGYSTLSSGYGSISNGARKEVSEYGQRPGKK
jgi:hypothetical protein